MNILKLMGSFALVCFIMMIAVIVIIGAIIFSFFYPGEL